MNNKVNIGSEIKLKLEVEPIGTLHLAQYSYTIEAYTTSNKSITISSSNIKVPSSTSDYILILIDTTDLGVGLLHLKMTAQIPDSDFADGYRTEICKINTGISIIN